MKRPIGIATLRSFISMMTMTSVCAHADSASFERETGLRASYLECYRLADLACIRDEIDEQSQRLNALLERSRGAARSQRERDAHDADQEHWRISRDAYCEAMTRTEGGDNPALVHADCQASATAFRVRALQAKPVTRSLRERRSSSSDHRRSHGADPTASRENCDCG